MKSSPNIQKAKAALWAKFTGAKDDKGYAHSSHDNLVPGVRLEQFKDDLLQGSGNELKTKFCAVHSSSALAVNCFPQVFHSGGRPTLISGTNGAMTRCLPSMHRI